MCRKNRRLRFRDTVYRPASKYAHFTQCRSHGKRQDGAGRRFSLTLSEKTAYVLNISLNVFGDGLLSRMTAGKLLYGRRVPINSETAREQGLFQWRF